MFLDFSWVAEPTAWGGLGTLILLEVVLGIDNLVFISILSSRLPEDKRRHAFTIGLSLALIMRLGLLSTIAWLIGLTKPWFSLLGYSFTARDIILLIGGLFLLLKGTMELHERLEGFQPTEEKAVHQAVFWQVITQIVVLDAIFSLDSIITSVGMVKELSIMMLAVIIAVLAMLLASRPLTEFVDRHPTVIILCLGFLLMIGLSLILEGLGYHIPKGYLYAAIGFSIVVEAFNQLALRNRRNRITTRGLRESAARAVLELLGGTTIPGGETEMEMAALGYSDCRDKVFRPEERAIVARVIRFGGRPAIRCSGSTATSRRKPFSSSSVHRSTHSFRSCAGIPTKCSALWICASCCGATRRPAVFRLSPPWSPSPWFSSIPGFPMCWTPSGSTRLRWVSFWTNTGAPWAL